MDLDARFSTPGDPVCAPDWLALREPADAAARASALVEPLRGRSLAVVRDLGCGSGSMGRWLRPLLPTGPWYLHDRDPVLLEIAARDGGIPVLGDLAAVDSFAGTDLVTCSALLDLLTAPEVDRLVDLCVDAGAAALFTLSVTGGVTLDPVDPLDAAVAAAFDAHQRRSDLLGPDAGAYAAEAFRSRGARVETAESPWRLVAGPLLEEWLRGRLAAAVEQDPALAPDAAAYLHRRLANPDLRAVVPHIDLLAH
ncbi:class I SAM-dependent methyltransferase [Pseudonocardia xishanensis]